MKISITNMQCLLREKSLTLPKKSSERKEIFEKLSLLLESPILPEDKFIELRDMVGNLVDEDRYSEYDAKLVNEMNEMVSVGGTSPRGEPSGNA